MKRKWCSIFLAGILTAGSIFPGGNVFAESENQQEIVITEKAEATEEIQESVQETPEPG